MRRREPFLPLLIEAHHVAVLCVPRPAGGETDEAYAQRLADELEQKIVELGAENVAAFVAETVVGATAGAVPPVRTYLKKIRAVCDKYGVLLILDEIMSGMGRTGYLYACDEDGVAPDLLTIAKGRRGLPADRRDARQRPHLPDDRRRLGLLPARPRTSATQPRARPRSKCSA